MEKNTPEEKTFKGIYRAFHILPQIYSANHATFAIHMYAIHRLRPIDTHLALYTMLYLIYDAITVYICGNF